MRIIVNHLTRMERGYICAAGVNPDNWTHVRPVVRGRVSEKMLAMNGGPFDIGAVVELGHTVDIGQAPSLEDRSFNPESAVRVDDLLPDDFWIVLRTVCKKTLRKTFGSDLQHTELSGGFHTCTLELGKGIASLGCLIPIKMPLLYVNDRGRLRISVSDGELPCTLPVTDLRLYEADHETPRHKAVADIVKRLGRGVDVILGVGVGRRYQKTGDPVAKHWLQVNNIHLRDNPLWKAP